MTRSIMKTFSAMLMASSFVGTYAQGGPLGQILAALNAENLTSLATAAQQVANTTAGQQIVALLSSGEPVTIFAPDNNAFTGVPKNISGNPELFAEVLSYHVIPGSFNFSFFGPNANTILRTALNASDQVFLDPGQNQVCACRKNGENVKVLNQNTDVELYNSTTIPGTNVTLNKVNAVIDLPGAFDALFSANNLTAFSAAAEQAGILPLLNFTHGITIFAPTNAAFEKALAQLGGSTNISQATLRNVLLNHVLNATVAYSSEFAVGNKYTTAAGEQISIISGGSNSSAPSLGISTSSSGGGISNASFVSFDFISWSGSLHIIDTVLFNNATDSAAASSAFESATASAASAASVQATATAPTGGLVGAPGSSATSTGSGRGGSPTGAAVSNSKVSGGLIGFAGLLVSVLL